MPKFFRFLAITLLALIFLVAKIEPVSAAQDDWDIKLNPNPVPVDAGRVTITVTRKDSSDFFIQPAYTMVAWTGQLDNSVYGHNTCRIISRNTGFNNDYYLGDLTISKTTATASWDWSDRRWWDFSSTCKVPGTVWHFRLFAGDNGDAMMSTGASIIDDYSFSLVQSSGVNPVTIEPKNNGDVYAGQGPIVIISNAVQGADYTFWWDEAQTEIAGYYQRDKDPNNPLEIKIPTFSTDISPRKLCMEYGNFKAPPGFNNCNPNVTFNFKPGNLPPVLPPPSGPAKCTVHPSSTIPLNNNADLRIENLPSGTKVSAYVIDQTKTSPEPTANGTVDSTNSVTLNLLKKATAIASYNVAAYTDSDPGQNICPNLTFTVGGTLVPPAKKCGDKDIVCSSAGGDPCTSDPNKPDPRGAGFKTAIGCIHTQPKALVEDFLKFATGIGGGLAFTMMLLGAFQMLTSGGNPQNLQSGRDVFTNAIIGLLFIIFSVLLMKIIGIDILNIPGFSQP